jgi:pimeloyl-ACP methyl ester carboxylesterase
LRFHYRVVGDRAAPPVVMLHGIMGHSREWDVLVESLASTYLVIVVDQRGHGETQWASEYTAAVMADDLIALIEQLGLVEPRVVGHSMGAMAAMLAAARRPELVRQLVIVDVGPDTVSGQLAIELAEFLRGLARASYGSVDEALAQWEANPFVRRDLLEHYVEHNLVPGRDGRLVWRFDGVGLARFFAGVSDRELWDAVDHIVCPVLLVRGEHSPALSSSTARAIVHRSADARLTVIPNASHDLGVERPEAVAGAASTFFASEAGSSGPRS